MRKKKKAPVTKTINGVKHYRIRIDDSEGRGFKESWHTYEEYRRLSRLARELNSETRKQKRDAARMIVSDRFDTSQASDDESAQREFNVTPKMKKALDNAISKITASRMRFVARKLIYSLMPMDEFLKRYPSYTRASKGSAYSTKETKKKKSTTQRCWIWIDSSLYLTSSHMYIDS